MATIGSAVLEIFPSARGMGGRIGQQIGGDLTAAGRAAGVKMGGAVADGLISQKGRIEKASATLASLRNREADAAGRVKVAEQQLAEVRANGNAKASQLVAAEGRFAKAKRDSALATDKAATAAKAYESAQAGLATGVGRTEAAFRTHGGTLDMVAGKMGNLAKTAGLITGGAALVAGGRQILTIGNDYTRTLNTMQAVSQGTAEQMSQVGARARELGNDISIPGTSASDAAAAMTELAKGGFSVEQSMTAAKGTLQLAAAAQIDAASAATIQSSALNTFGLSADSAGKAADVLANAANASSAEITDIAYGLQAGGAVAKGFGLSMEDTATALAMFANQGIKGSDAGTLLKSTLLAITDQGNPAQAAIEELGLSLYNQEGRFVGLSSLMHQLETASKGMTQEQYQAATAVLFGSDAARTALGAAGGTAKAYDDMRVAIDRQGAAAEVAAAKTQGLPGAIEAVKNTAEGAAIAVYDLVDGPLNSLMRGGLDGLDKLGGKIREAWDGFAASERGQALFAQLDRIMASASRSAEALAPAIGGIVQSLGTGAAAAGFIAFKTFATGLEAAATVLEIITPAVSALSGFMSEHQAIVTGAVLAYAAFKTVPTVVGLVSSSVERLTSVTGAARTGLQSLTAGGIATQMRESFTVGAASASGFGSAVSGASGVVRAGATGMRASLSSLVGYLGGGFALGLTAGVGALTFAVAQMGAASSKIADAESTYRAAAEGVAASNTRMLDALNKSGGAIDDSVVSVMTERIGNLRETNEAYARDAPGMWGIVATGFKTAGGLLNQTAADSLTNAERLSRGGEQVASAFDKLNMSNEDLSKVVTGNGSAFADLTSKLTRAGGGSAELASQLITARGEFMASQSSASQVGAAMQAIEDGAVGAARGVDDLTNAMMRQFNDGRTLEEAQKAVTMALEGFRGALAGGGLAAVDAAGKIDLSTSAGVRLDDQMKQVRAAWLDAAGAARASATDQHLSAADTEAAVAAAQQRVRDEFIATAEESGVTYERAKVLADLFLNWPETAKTTLELNDGPAKDAINRFIAENQNRTVQVTLLGTLANGNNVVAPGNGASGQLDGAFMMPGVPRANGGPITGGVPGKDSVPILGMPGEHMLTTDDVDALGGQDGVYRFRSALQSGKVGKYAVGGSVGASWFDRVRNWFAPRNGNDYLWGGTGPDQFDCSGAVGGAQQLALGASAPSGRVGTTYTAIGGSWPNIVSGASRSDLFALGVSDEHMAATINGVNLESGGAANALQWGGSAAGAWDSQFPYRFHIPNELLGPVGSSRAGAGALGTSGGGSTRRKTEWTEKDSLQLDSALISVRQAEEDAAAATADPKKSDADKDQAANKVKRAKERVASLERKRDAANSGTEAPAPQAPELTSALTDDEIDLKMAELAIEKADDDRNEVYDSADSTDEAKLEADLSLQRAKNSLAEKIKQQREAQTRGKAAGAGGTRLKTFQELGADMGGILAGGLLETFGLKNSFLADPNSLLGADSGSNVRTSEPLASKTGELAKPINVPTISITPDEVMTQMPMTLDPTKGLEQLLRLPGAKLFDSGGYLDGLGVNLSGKPEPVLTSEEDREWRSGNAAVAEMVRALKAGEGGGGRGDAPLIGELHSHGPSARDVAREVDMKLDARMSTYTGRFRG